MPMTATDSILRGNIIKFRGNKTQDELAAELGIKRTVLKSWETGERRVKAADVAALAKVFGESADTLLGIPEKTTGLSAEAAARIKVWSKDRYAVRGSTDHTEVESLAPSLYDTFEKMIECEEFERFLRALSYVGAIVHLETTVFEHSGEYDLYSFSERVGFALFQLAKQAENLAKTMYSVDETEQELERMLKEE